jgi:hypothetical protein
MICTPASWQTRLSTSAKMWSYLYVLTITIVQIDAYALFKCAPLDLTHTIAQDIPVFPIEHYTQNTYKSNTLVKRTFFFSLSV